MAHQAGSAAGLERLMEEYGTGLLRLCALQLGDAALAEDAAQEDLTGSGGGTAPSGGRRQSAPGLQRLPSTCAGICSAPRGTPTDGAVRPAEPAAEDAPWDDTPLRAVLSLPRKYREVVLLRYYEEFTLEEIADTLGIVPGTVSARLTRAKRKLRPMLEEWYYD